MELRLVLPLAGSGRAAHTPQPGSAQAQTHPLGFVASHLMTSSLPRPQMRSGPAAGKNSQGCVGTPAPMDGQGKEGGTNGTDSAHQQKYPLSARSSQNIKYDKGRV